jgi:hypothetical protein
MDLLLGRDQRNSRVHWGRTEKLSHKSVLKGRGFSRAVQSRIKVGALAPEEIEAYTFGPL